MSAQLRTPLWHTGTGALKSLWISLQPVLVVSSLYTIQSWFSSTPMSGDQTVWFQKEVTIASKKRGCHLITDEVVKDVPELKNIKVGLAHIHIKHTSASLALNENWDPDVRVDTEMMLNKIVPEGEPYRHSCEGPDDMPAHIKAALIGSSVTIPVTSGKFNLGTWQGLWLCEHRNHAGSRKLVVTLQGARK